MKKNIIKYISVAFLCASMSSCEDYLDTTPPDKASPDTFLKDTEQAQSLLAGIYNCFYDEGAGYINPYTYENMSDNSYNPNTWEYSAEFAQGSQTASSHWAGYKWKKDWQGVSRANSLLRGLASNSTLSTTDKNKLIAESRFMRGYL